MSTVAKRFLAYRAMCEREGLMTYAEDWLTLWYGPNVLRRWAVRLLDNSGEPYPEA